MAAAMVAGNVAPLLGGRVELKPDKPSPWVLLAPVALCLCILFVYLFAAPN
jgi:hypothetical protein